MSTLSIPSVHRAVTAVQDPSGYTIISKALPIPEDDEILVKVASVTLNPTDWKHVYRGGLKPTSSTGSDFAGDVVFVGKAAEGKGVKIGDAVAGYLRGGYIDSANGAFQEYLKSRPESVWVVPKDRLSYEEAAPMGGIALSTAVQVLYHRLKLPTPWAPAQTPFPVLIWAGSTSVGIYAVKLAKLSGLQVVTTASPHNFELMRKLGADTVYDYKDPETPAKIKQWGNGKIAHALDAISEHGSTELTLQSLGHQDAKVITLIPFAGKAPENVDVAVTLVYSALDRKNADDFDSMADWNRRLPQYASELNVMPLKKWPGGLEGIAEALEYLKAGKASAEKISLKFE